MVGWNRAPSREPARRRTMFPGRELPPPVPVTFVDASLRMGGQQYDTADMNLHQATHYTQQHTIVQSFPSPPPNIDVAHKVWMLNCKHCGTFITNRGMKCVLLLRPDVNLFSSDAMPVNSSVYQSNPHSPRERTCECLSQTLCCHGCGTAIGYMIVAPCARCAPGMGLTPTAPYSFGQTQQPRITSGHRFVFHSTEVGYEERLYVAGEPDVRPDARSQEVFASMVHQLPSHEYMSKIPRLKPGEILYWHQLIQSGDMAGGVFDDVRARASQGYRYDPVTMRRPSRIIAGR